MHVLSTKYYMLVSVAVTLALVCILISHGGQIIGGYMTGKC